MYQHIIFDVDGTLIDTSAATIMALNKVLKEETGLEYSHERLKSAIGIPGQVSLPGFGVKNIDVANLKWNRYLKEYSSYIRVYPGIVEVLVKLKEFGIRPGIVTSNTKFEFNGLLEYFKPFHLLEYVEHIICADDTKYHKPFPHPILKFLGLSGADPDMSIYIGDTVYDMECAKAANVNFGLAGWGHTVEGLRAERVFNTPEDILQSIYCSPLPTRT